MDQMEQQYGQRITSLEKEVHGLNASISEVRSDGAATRNRVDRMADSLDRFMERETTPWITPGTVAGIVGSLLATALVFAFGIAEYVAIRDEPLRQSIQLNADNTTSVMEGLDEFLRIIEDFRTETHYEVALGHAFREETKAHMNMDDERFYRVQDDLDRIVDRLSKLEAEQASEKMATRALGDYVKEHVNDTVHHPRGLQ